MSFFGKLRVAAMPDYTEDNLGMLEPAYLPLEEKARAHSPSVASPTRFSGADTDSAVEFFWKDNDEMDEAQGDDWAELQPDGSLNARSASRVVTRSNSLPAEGFLQQPARTNGPQGRNTSLKPSRISVQQIKKGDENPNKLETLVH